MARPVKITNIGTREHAAKLVKALRKDHPDWTVSVTEQSDGRFAVSSAPPSKRAAGDDEEGHSACPLPPLPHWIDRDPISRRKRINREPAAPIWNCADPNGGSAAGPQFRT